jgi:hypothetical protein
VGIGRSGTTKRVGFDTARTTAATEWPTSLDAETTEVITGGRYPVAVPQWQMAGASPVLRRHRAPAQALHEFVKPQGVPGEL